MRKNIPSQEINASSMADVAFLLLTFFLVATSFEKTEGIFQEFTEKDPSKSQIIVQENDVLRFVVGPNDKVQLRNKTIKISEISEQIISHVDNGVGRKGADDSGELCTYCKGKKLPYYSDHPHDALLVFHYLPNVTFQTYIAIQEQIDKAFFQMRNKYAKDKYGITYIDAIRTQQNEIIADIESKYPKNIVEPRLQNDSL